MYVLRERGLQEKNPVGNEFGLLLLASQFVCSCPLLYIAPKQKPQRGEISQSFLGTPSLSFSGPFDSTLRVCFKGDVFAWLGLVL